MKCPQCGNEIADGAELCAKCNSIKDIDAIPPGIKGFNWSAFFFGWIWAFAHRLWLWGGILFVFSFGYKILPIAFADKLNISGMFYWGVFAIYILLLLFMGFKGNALTWKTGRFKNEIQFKEVQKKWSRFISPFICLYLMACCIPVGLPNFLRSLDKSRYNKCLHALTTLQVGEDKYKKENGKYTAAIDELGAYLIPECKGKNSCNKKVAEWMKHLPNTRECKNIQIKLIEDGSEYQIKGTALDRSQCKICVTKKGFSPDHYGYDACKSNECP